jgi:hypothetical protein
MKTLEFQGCLNPDRTMVVPESVAEQLPTGQPLRVLILLAESESEEQQWSRMATAEFLKGYAESDAVYDDLPTG